MKKKSIHIEIPISTYFIQILLNITESIMLRAGAGKINEDSKTYSFVLAIEEIVMNIIRHNSQSMPRDAHIDIIYFISNENVTAKITDKGSSYQTPKEYDEKTVLKQFSGMGLHFVRSLLDKYQYEYNEQEKTNNVILEINLLKKSGK